MKAMQKGFTLIELMIVVAIIAILAAIAIPQYETYITKSQFTEATTVATGMETDINLAWNQNGACPVLGTTAGFPANATSYEGKYVASATIGAGTASAGDKTCDITVTFKGAGSVSKPLQGATVLFQGAASGGNFTWKCSSTGVADKYKPETCR